jgi:fibronectin type 3 domain-containing protein
MVMIVSVFATSIEATTLAWDAPSPWDFAEPPVYAIYRSANNTGYQFIGTTMALIYVDDTVSQQNSYCYNVTAQSSDGQESVPSNIVCVSCVVTKGRPPHILKCK